jgi:hypothetical protein
LPVRVTLRTAKDFSPFREMLHRLIRLPEGDDLVLCSGYIWEPPSTSKDYKILDDELLDALQSGCDGKEITTIAGKLDEQWLSHYKNFVRRLRQAGIQVKPYFAPKRNWHAKIAIRLKQGEPIATIIGSSNLTGPAYGENRYTWNFESDVVIWRNFPALNNAFRAPFQTDTLFGDMQLIVDPEIRQLNEEQQLNRIYRDTMDNDFSELTVE